MKPGLFITFEGTEGCGKSTQIRLLGDRLSALGLRVKETREPGGTAIGEELRQLLKHSPGGVGMAPETELLLVNASRAQLVREVIRPWLDSGGILLCDRYYDSTIAYQAFGRGLELARVRAAIDVAVGTTRPDLTLLLDLSSEASERRRTDRDAANRPQFDRFEQEGRDFFDRVNRGYQTLAAAEPGRIRRVPAEATVETVAASVWAWVEPLLPGKNPAGASA
jgi:dTMP kinase